MDEAALFRLLSWLSPAFPVGAFSYSHGLEWAIEVGLVREEASLRAWLEDLLAHGTLAQDACLAALAHRAVECDDRAGFAELRALAAALPPTAELLLETTAQAGAFARTVLAAWPDRAERIRPYLAEPEEPPALVFPLAVAAATAAHGVPRRAALLALVHASTSNLVSAAMRLVPLGQSTGQRVLAALEGAVLDAVARAERARLEELGTGSLVLDWCSLRHETQYTRLFRS
ncbi:MAG: urease accessory UreF family protein [Geminicoccaceae bacterium]|nr:urease accessory UreF family protein [Geminicoccaceae bacterium]